MKKIPLSIFILSLIASIFHFLFDASGKSLLIGLFTPVNESVWEHLKLAIIPTIIWYLIAYKLYFKKDRIGLKKVMVGVALTIFSIQFFIVTFYYTYTGIFGIKSLFLDISSLYIGIIISQIISFCYLYKSTYNNIHFYIAIIYLVFIIIINIIFTINPLHLPIFFDESKNSYGI